MALRIILRLSEILVLVITVFGIAQSVNSPGARAAGPCAAAATPLDAEETAFLDALNAYRTQRGLVALKPVVTLRRSTLWHAADMSTRNYFSHTDSAGRSPGRRALDCGYPVEVSQNIAAGTLRGTGAAALALFLSSPLHVAVLGDPAARYIGIARSFTEGSTYGWYWATDFSATADPAGLLVPPAPAAAPVAASSNGGITPLSFIAGWNLVSWPMADSDPATVLAGTAVTAAYEFDPYTATWTRYTRSAPAYANSLTRLRQGAVYWFVVE